MAESKYLKRTQGNGASTTLSASITNADTSAPLTSDTAFDGEGMLLIDEGQATEEFAYGTGKVGSSITILADDRGLEGGSAQAHSDTATVKGVITSGMWNNMVEAVSKTVSATDGTLLKAAGADINTGTDDAKIVTSKAIADSYINTGWIPNNDTWTYASATTFTIAGVDRTAMFPKGTKIKLTQGTVKYFYVVGSSFSTNTTITVTGGSTYTLANAAITSPYYSYASTPQGFPQFLAYTPTWSNVTIGSATVFAQFTMIGKLVWVKLSVVFASNSSISGTIGFSLPIPGDTDISNNIMIGTNYAENAGTAGYCGFVRQGSTTTANPTLYSGSFYNATVPFTWGNGDFFKCVFTYEAA
jgi:hypothetical protein